MGLCVAALNSGSNGNCYIIGTPEEFIMVDAGLSCREVEKRLSGLGLSASGLKAILITHEHSDHISGLLSIVKKLHVPVYITAITLSSAGLELDQVFFFERFVPITIGRLTVTAFPKFHDASDPHSVIVEGYGSTAGVFTDIGQPCANVMRYFKQCHAVFLESNYEEAMLAASRYPVFLQRRISGKHGHLSNAQALQLFLGHRSSFLTHLILSHLSKENNRPETVEALFQPHAAGLVMMAAPRDRATPLFVLSSTPPAKVTTPAKTGRHQYQLSLF